MKFTHSALLEKKNKLQNVMLLKKLDFDSVMIQDSDLNLGDKRLLTVDNVLYVPAKTTLRFVIHLKTYYMLDLYQNLE